MIFLNGEFFDSVFNLTLKVSLNISICTQIALIQLHHNFEGVN